MGISCYSSGLLRSVSVSGLFLLLFNFSSGLHPSEQRMCSKSLRGTFLGSGDDPQLIQSREAM